MLSEKLKTIFDGTDKLDELAQIMAECDSAENLIDELKKQIDEKDSTIADLNSRNAKLFMQITGTAQVEDEEDKDPQEVLNEILDEILSE